MNNGRKTFEERLAIQTRAGQDVVSQKGIKPVIDGKTEFIRAAHMRLLYSEGTDWTRKRPLVNCGGQPNIISVLETMRAIVAFFYKSACKSLMRSFTSQP